MVHFVRCLMILGKSHFYKTFSSKSDGSLFSCESASSTSLISDCSEKSKSSKHHFPKRRKDKPIIKHKNLLVTISEADNVSKKNMRNKIRGFLINHCDLGHYDWIVMHPRDALAVLLVRIFLHICHVLKSCKVKTF